MTDQEFDGPLIVQSDLSVLLEIASPAANAARQVLARFAELEKAPEHVHTYRINPLSLWNAAVSGVSDDDVIAALQRFAKYPISKNVLVEVRDQMSRYGRLRLVDADEGAGLILRADSPALFEEVSRVTAVAPLLGDQVGPCEARIRLGDRGAVKQTLLVAGWPVADEAGFQRGAPLGNVELLAELRPYQNDALQAWWVDGAATGGSGVITLPCGAGKTVIGLGAIVAAGQKALVICTSVSAVRQWISEALDKTTLTEDDLGEWTGRRKQLRAVTFVTYSSLTWADPSVDRDGPLHERHPNLAVFDNEQWGLAIYDEVHLLPAPVFRATARIQAVRRLGLTATLIREDGREGDVFSLIGPKRYDSPWTDLEAQGWIAPARCVEIRVPMTDDARMAYAITPARQRHRVAATATEKLDVLEAVLTHHVEDQVLVIGQFIDQLRAIAERLGAPLLTGQSGQATRDRLFDQFRAGEIPVLVVSKIANVALDLPEAGVAIQMSGQFGSRQEEAQRLGRLLRPKVDGRTAVFYSIITSNTDEQRFARNRQRFLAEQGYAYEIIDAEEFLSAVPAV